MKWDLSMGCFLRMETHIALVNQGLLFSLFCFRDMGLLLNECQLLLCQLLLSVNCY